MFSKSGLESSFSGHFFGTSVALSDLLQMKAAKTGLDDCRHNSRRIIWNFSTFDFSQRIRSASGVTHGDNHLSNLLKL